MRYVRNIVLVGVTGAGKSTVGPKLASYMSLPVLDTDVEIDRRGVSGYALIQNQGIEAFREIEKDVSVHAIRNFFGVIATGAGAWTILPVRREAEKISASVWLKADYATLVRRVRDREEARFLVEEMGAEQVVHEQIINRNEYYAQADVVVDASRSPEEVVREIVNKISHLKVSFITNCGES